MVRVHLPEPNALDVRDLWDSITSAVGGAFNDDKTTTTSDKATKTAAKTVLTTETPKGFTGELTTKTTSTAKTADKTTSTAKKTTATTTSEDKTTSTKAAAKTTATSTSASTSTTADKTDKTTDKTDKTTNRATATSTSTSIPATTAASSETVLTLAPGTPTTSSTANTATATSATASPTTSSAAAAASTGSSSGSSPATKAGIAIGVLAGIFFVALAVFLLFRRHKRQQGQRRLDDEKTGPFADSAASVVGAASAGAASTNAGAGAGTAGAVRGGVHGDNAIALQNQAPMGNRGPYGNMNRVPGGAAAWGERPTTSQSQNQNNPFGDSAQRLNPGSSSTNPNLNTPVSPSTGATAGAAAAGAAAAAAGVYTDNLTRKASTRKDGPQSLDLTLAAPRAINGNAGLAPVPPSPSGTDYSMTSMPSAQSQSTSPIAVGYGSGSAAIAAAGGPPVSAVHRVQLDFKPTLDDELGLRAGQLVRLLHEYDDGWALCIRLDRSQQGVVPRTCLSTRPVKPRPPPNGSARPGPPINTNPHGRPMTSQGRQGGPPRPTNSNMPRTQSPSPMYSELPATPAPPAPPAPPSVSSNKAPSLPPMSFSELPAFNSTPSDASRSPSPNSSNRTMSPAPASAPAPAPAPAPPVTASPIAMPTAETPAIGVATSVPAPVSASASSPVSYTPGTARMRPGTSIGRKPVPGQAL